MHRYWNFVNWKKEDMKKVQEKKIYFEMSSKPNVDIVVIAVSMWKIYEFETIFTSNDFMNIQFGIDKGFGYRERAYHTGVNEYFGPRQKYRPHATPNFGPGKFNFEVDYYRQTYCSPIKLAHTRKKI